jgi:hypothetical protein
MTRLPQAAAEVTAEHTALILRMLDAAEHLAKDLGKAFTLDGKLVGDIGEVVAAWLFYLRLLPDSYPGVDALTRGGESTVSIKATFGTDEVRFRGDEQCKQPDCVVVLRLKRSESVEVVYAGPAAPVMEYLAPRRVAASNGQKTARLRRLRELQAELTVGQQLTTERRVML